MRLIPLMLLAVCCSASAEWLLVDQSNKAKHFVNLENIKRRGDLVEIWQITNLFAPDDDGTLSRRGLEQHDCRNDKWRLLYLSSHSDHWANGRIIFSRSYEEAEAKWTRIPPETISESIHKIVCKK